MLEVATNGQRNSRTNGSWVFVTAMNLKEADNDRVCLTFTASLQIRLSTNQSILHSIQRRESASYDPHDYALVRFTPINLCTFTGLLICKYELKKFSVCRCTWPLPLPNSSSPFAS